MVNHNALARRGVIVHVTTLALLTSIVTLGVSQLGAQSAQFKDAWLKRASAKHRQLFDAPASGGGVPLIHMLNYYDTWNKAHGVADKDIAAVGTFYGATTFFGVNDAMWAKYRIGEFLGEKDPAGALATANPWRVAPVILGMVVAIEQAHAAGFSYHRQ